MTDTTAIMKACFDHLETLVYSPQPAILFPGMGTKPPQEGMWLKPALFPGEPRDRSWDEDTDCAEERGFFQVLVYFKPRPKLGLIAPSKLADAVIAHYRKGTVLGPVKVKKRPHQSTEIVEDKECSFIPVTIYYLGLM